VLVACLLSASSGTIEIDSAQVREPCPILQLYSSRMSCSIGAPSWPTAAAVEIKKLDAVIHRQRPRDLLRSVGFRIRGQNIREIFSGGHAPRVSICRALGMPPSLLLMDEPFGSLDALTLESMNLVSVSACGCATAIPCFVHHHSIEEAVRLADGV